MSRVLGFFAALGRGIGWFVGLIRNGEDDLQGTYPDRPVPTGEQAATQASVTTNLAGLGNSGM